MKDMRFDAVIDVTAYNRMDIEDLLNSFEYFGRYILISSSAVYPETAPQPFSEKEITGSNSHWGDYGINKIDAESALRKRIAGAQVIRPPYLYGKMNNLYREAFVFECAEKNLPFYVPGDGNMKLQFFDIEDLCRIIEIIILNNPSIRICNVGNPETVTVSDWVKLCYGILGKSPEIRYISTDIDTRLYFPFQNYEYSLDVSRQKYLLSDVKSLEQGLSESYEWYKKHRELVIRKDYLQYINKNFI